jgi:hypothetical protein
MREFFDLANNPLFVKHLRSRLRRSAVLPGVIIVVFLSLCIIFLHSQAKKNNPNTDIGSHFFFWMQGFILVLLGGAQVASSIAQIKESGIIDFHRITPVPARIQTLGIMLGAPIRELILYVATMPFAIYLAIDGPIGITSFCKLLLVQLGSALMYYSLAMITGLTGAKARGATGRYVGILALVNFFAIKLFIFGIYGPTLITTAPIYIEVFRLDEDDQQAQQQQAQQQRQFQGGKGAQAQQFGGPNQGQPNQQIAAQKKRPPITFYGLALPVVLQSLLFQGCLLTFLFIGASRRIHSARLPLYTKPMAVLFLIALAALTLGSLWDTPTLALTLGSVYFLTICAIMLTKSVTAPLGDVIKAMQRARKLSGLRVPIWSDLASNKFTAFFFACIIGATVSIGLLAAPQPPALGFIQIRHVFSPWPPLLVGVLTVLTYGFTSQYFALAFGKRAGSYFTLFVFFAWFTPIIVGILAISLDVDGGGYVLAISPIVGIAFSGAFGIPRIDEVVVKVCAIAPGAIFTIMFFVLLINEERKLLGEVVDEHAFRKRRKQDLRDDYEDERDERNKDHRRRDDYEGERDERNKDRRHRDNYEDERDESNKDHRRRDEDHT